MVIGNKVLVFGGADRTARPFGDIWLLDREGDVAGAVQMGHVQGSINFVDQVQPTVPSQVQIATDGSRPDQ